MYQHLIELSVSKAATDAESDVLRDVLVAAIAVDEEERKFSDRINTNKALRGEAPTKLSKRKKAEIDGYAADAREMEAQQVAEFSGFDSAQSIVYCLKTALDGDVKFWGRMHEKAHPADAPIVQSFAAAKARLRDAMAAYLSVYRAHES
jgi:hypothetical protein